MIGNHDANDGGPSNYRRYLGPDYYSLDYGDCHFLIVNSMHKTPQQAAWIAKDLELLRGKKRLFIFQHSRRPRRSTSSSPPTRPRACSPATGILSTPCAHQQHEFLQHRQLPVRRHRLFAGRFQGHRRGPRADHQPDALDRDGRRLTIVTPAESLLIPEGDLIVLVNAYETSAVTVSIRYELKAGDQSIANGELKAQGD